MNQSVIEKAMINCEELILANPKKEKPVEYNYTNIPFCVIDAIFSIGVRYESVLKTIEKINEYYTFNKIGNISEITTSDFLELYNRHTIEEITTNIFNNRQRTSTKNGILKTEAVRDFLKILKKYGVETLADIRKKKQGDQFESEIKAIKGQGSGISLKYFYMLTGTESEIKPDRMIKRFLKSIEDRNYTDDECLNILTGICNQLKQKGISIAPRELDNIIWEYQRSRVNPIDRSTLNQTISKIDLPNENKFYRETNYGGKSYKEEVMIQNEKKYHITTINNNNYLKIELFTWYEKGPGDIPYTSKTDELYFIYSDNNWKLLNNKQLVDFLIKKINKWEVLNLNLNK